MFAEIRSITNEHSINIPNVSNSTSSKCLRVRYRKKNSFPIKTVEDTTAKSVFDKK